MNGPEQLTVYDPNNPTRTTIKETNINNNHSGNQSKRGFDRIYGGEQTEKAFELWGLSKVNFAKIAEDMGALGIRVEKPGELKSAFDQAFSANRPVVLDVVSEINALAPVAHS